MCVILCIVCDQVSRIPLMEQICKKNLSRILYALYNKKLVHARDVKIIWQINKQRIALLIASTIYT